MSITRAITKRRSNIPLLPQSTANLLISTRPKRKSSLVSRMLPPQGGRAFLRFWASACLDAQSTATGAAADGSIGRDAKSVLGLS